MCTLRECDPVCLDLLEEEWDIAIILDACRYDAFKDVCREYLPRGKLEKRYGASDTLDWLTSVFGGNGRYNSVVYVSAHPGINGKGVAWGFFNAKEKFHKVYDAWLKGWNWRLGTTSPEEVAKTAIQARKKHTNKKLIAHFVQPHFPYRKAPCPSTYSDLKGVKRNRKLGILLEKLLRKLVSLLDVNLSGARTAYWTVKKFFNMRFLEDLNELYWKEYDIDKLKNFYKDNLKWVLKYAREIVEEFGDDKIVITSDHGEAFGEGGDFFHLYKTKNPVVRWVPFWHN